MFAACMKTRQPPGFLLVLLKKGTSFYFFPGRSSWILYLVYVDMSFMYI